MLLLVPGHSIEDLDELHALTFQSDRVPDDHEVGGVDLDVVDGRLVKLLREVQARGVLLLRQRLRVLELLLRFVPLLELCSASLPPFFFKFLPAAAALLVLPSLMLVSSQHQQTFL